MTMGSVAAFKLFVAIVLYLFLPLTAAAYFFSRRQRRVIEVNRMLEILNIDPAYAKAYAPDGLPAYLLGVAYASIIACNWSGAPSAAVATSRSWAIASWR